mmetsp:Transcript_71922/g.164936  ORF Transcript_71922/g.164936 Transcript_71922/m.164936 type:complete len:213 (+) Transcript_71922:1035-1673(+)
MLRNGNSGPSIGLLHDWAALAGEIACHATLFSLLPEFLDVLVNTLHVSHSNGVPFPAQSVGQCHRGICGVLEVHETESKIPQTSICQSVLGNKRIITELISPIATHDPQQRLCGSLLQSSDHQGGGSCAVRRLLCGPRAFTQAQASATHTVARLAFEGSRKQRRGGLAPPGARHRAFHAHERISDPALRSCIHWHGEKQKPETGNQTPALNP